MILMNRKRSNLNWDFLQGFGLDLENIKSKIEQCCFFSSSSSLVLFAQLFVFS